MISKYFITQELVPPDIYTQYGEKSMWFIDPRLIILADFLREFVGQPMTINNWDSGHTLSLRGFRPPDTTVGGRLSQHKFGRAFDCSFDDILPRTVYNSILSNEKLFMEQGLTTLENIEFTKSWLHCDIRHTGSSSLLIVNP